MAAEPVDCCAMCLESWDDTAYVLPCFHKYCYACILPWARSKRDCPLCRREVTSVLHLGVADNSLEEYVVAEAVVPSAAGLVGGLPARDWARVFQQDPALLQTLLPWLEAELGPIVEGGRLDAPEAQRIVLGTLCIFGLDEGTLTRVLQPALGRPTGCFVHRLIEAAVAHSRRWLGMGEARPAEQEDGPTAAPAAPSGDPNASGAELPSTSAAARHGTPSGPTAAPVPAGGAEEQRPEEPEGAAAGGPAPRQGSGRSTRRPRRAPKRNASSAEATASANKRPRRRRQ